MCAGVSNFMMMRGGGFSRLYRRTVLKHFGSSRNFLIWSVAVILTIYFIDSYILTRDRLESLVTGEGGVQKLEQGALPPQNEQKKPDPLPPDNVAKDAEKPADAEAKQPDMQQQQPLCGMTTTCPSGQVPYLIQSGHGRDVSPTICFNGNKVVSPEKGNGKRGLNVVIINDKTLDVEDLRYFDTYAEDDVLIRYLRLGVPDHYVILLATQDEASYHLSTEGKNYLKQFGSTEIDKLKFRDNMVLAGQRGLQQGKAIEKHVTREANKDFADQIVISGCLTLPMGPLEELARVDVDQPADVVKHGDELAECGVKDKCGDSAFPVHIYSGVENREGPKICVNGKYYMAQGLNDGGRGFNVVIVDPKTKQVTRVGHFDTYAEDSSNLEIFLEMMNEKEIVVAVTHDDASKKLSDHAKKLLNDMGSGLIQNMKFRDVWGFVGQKGIKGYVDNEQVEFTIPSTNWPKPIDKRMCIPTELKGSQIKPDPLANKNEKRRTFCGKYDGYGEFCETEHIDEPLVPAPLTDKALENHAIFSVPIIVVPGLNHNAVRMQLETLLLNPGIKPDMVTVLFDEKFDEPSALADLFTFKSHKLSSSNKYIYQMEKALEKVWELYPAATSAIILEEEVIPGQDFLGFLGQVYDVTMSDASLAGISAWNDNGYQGSSGDPSLAFRVDSFPGLGFLLKKAFYDQYMKGKIATCCYKRSWDVWSAGVNVEMVVPDMSRVYRRPYAGLSEQAEFLQSLFNKPRNTLLTLGSQIKNVNSLASAAYEQEITSLLSSSTPLDTSNVEDCLHGRGLGFYIPKTPGKVFSIYYEQSSAADFRILSLLTKCFGAFSSPGHPPRGLHKGLLRLTSEGNVLLIVGSLTPYYKHVPQSYKPVSLSQLPAS